MLCVPLLNSAGDCIAVVQAVNKLVFRGPSTPARPAPTSSAEASVTGFVTEDKQLLERIGDIAGGILHRLQLEHKAVSGALRGVPRVGSCSPDDVVPLLRRPT